MLPYFFPNFLLDIPNEIVVFMEMPSLRKFKDIDSILQSLNFRLNLEFVQFSSKFTNSVTPIDDPCWDLRSKSKSYVGKIFLFVVMD